MTDSAVYVAVGSNGLVKVGRSSRPKIRLQSLKRDFKLMGNEVINFYHSEPFRNSWSAEYELIKFAREYEGVEVAYGREFFRCIDPDACIEKAKSLAIAGLNEMREAERIKEEERKAYRDAAEKRAKTKEKKMEDLRQKHFAEFIELQKSGQMPIPELATKEAK